MLTFNDFVNFAVENIKDWMPESYKDAEVRVDKFCKPGAEYTGLTILSGEEETNVSAVVNLEMFYDLYSKKEEDIGKLMTQMAELLTQEKPDFNIDESFIKDHLFVRLVKNNDPFLAGVAHMAKAGFTAVAYAEIEEKAGSSGYACIKQGDALGLSDAELLDLALKQSPETLPATLQPLSRMGMAIMAGSELLRLVEVGASCFNHYCVDCDLRNHPSYTMSTGV